jgi:hypothetical protein
MDKSMVYKSDKSFTMNTLFFFNYSMRYDVGYWSIDKNNLYIVKFFVSLVHVIVKQRKIIISIVKDKLAYVTMVQELCASDKSSTL